MNSEYMQIFINRLERIHGVKEAHLTKTEKSLKIHIVRKIQWKWLHSDVAIFEKAKYIMWDSPYVQHMEEIGCEISLSVE